jgi:hypothetical protein
MIKFAYSILFVYFTLTAHDCDVTFSMVVMGAIITIVHDGGGGGGGSDKYPVF